MKTKLSAIMFSMIKNPWRISLLALLLAVPSMAKAQIISNVAEEAVTKLYSISSTGAQAFNTGYTHKANTRVVMHCKVTQDHASRWEALLGARLNSYHSNAFCFFSRTDGNDIPCFNRSGNEPRGSGFVYGEPIMLDCNGKTASWYRMDDLSTAVGSVTTTGTADAGKTPMLLFNLNTSKTEGGVTIDTSPSVMTLYACNIFEGDTQVCEFVPAKYNGVVGLYDRKRKTFSGSITGTPFVGASATKHAISLNAGDGGKLVTNLTQARPGTTVGLWQFPADGYELESLSIKDGNGQDVSYTTTAATSVEMLTNGTCDGTYTGWTKTNGGSGWDTASDYYGRDWWESSFGVCTLSQTITLSDFGVTGDSIDNGGINVTASATYLEGFNKNGNGARVCTVKVYMLDSSGNTLSTATVVNNDLAYSSAWKSKSTTFELVAGTRQLKYEVQGRDATDWSGQYGPGFRNLSLKLEQPMDAFTFEMPESDVTITATFIVELIDGDLNMDGSVTIADVMELVNIIMGGENSSQYAQNADIDGDGDVSIADVMCLVNYLLGKPNPGEEPQAYLTCPDDHHPHLIDLGLPSGRKWACCNVGADKPEDYGDYFAWGEVTPQSDNAYSESSYKWCKGSIYELTKYCTDYELGYNGFVDNKTVLDAEDDAAYANWGSGWRMPTESEFEELIGNTTSERVTQNGVEGYKFTGTNKGSIFLPAAGFVWDGELYDVGSGGYYWSSTLDESYPVGAWCPYFDSGYVNTSCSYRFSGQSVRPVRQN